MKRRALWAPGWCVVEGADSCARVSCCAAPVQKAIHSAAEDEAEFKRVARDLQARARPLLVGDRRRARRRRRMGV